MITSEKQSSNEWLRPIENVVDPEENGLMISKNALEQDDSVGLNVEATRPQRIADHIHSHTRIHIQ